MQLGLATDIVDEGAVERAVAHCREHGVVLPTFEQLAAPAGIPNGVRADLSSVGPDDADPRNLFRVHWFNDGDRTGVAKVPAYVVFDEAVTGVEAPIVVALGSRFPMIGAHKVLAAYGCLAPRLVTGQFDPTVHRAIWPSTGNYCRGGVAISKLMGCRGVAVLPEGMSRERFEWLENWVVDPSDIVRTPGTESNVKEIYDTCAQLAADPQNVIFNQFCEFGNYLVHCSCTATALAAIFADVRRTHSGLEIAAFVSATGSAGTIGAGDYLKDLTGCKIVAAEALECPTLLENGFGEHNIQGIGDKHVPYIHNVMNTDFVVAISDAASDSLHVLFNSEAGQGYLQERWGLSPVVIGQLAALGLSGICNLLAAIKIARHQQLGPEQAVFTVATDSAELYGSERTKIAEQRFAGGFDRIHAAEVYGQHLLGLGSEHVLELTSLERRRIFNLGYYTWVEQQGVPVEDFEARRDQRFWQKLHDYVPVWNELIDAFNARTGLS